MQDMILPVIFPGLFDGQNVMGFFNNADRLGRTGGAVAIVARIPIRKVIAARTVADFFFCLQNRATQPIRICLGTTQYAVSQSLGRFWRLFREACGIRRSVFRWVPRSRSFIYFFSLYGPGEDIKEGFHYWFTLRRFQNIASSGWLFCIH